MTERKQQLEIERLQKKIKALSEAYRHTAEELQKIKAKEKKPGRRGRPAIDSAAKARVLSLCHQGHSMRAIAKETSLALGTVHKIIAEASQDARIVYIYMDRTKPATLIDACSLTHKVKIINFTDNMVSRAFGINEHPDWDAFTAFLEDRCMPRTRYGIREELKYMGLSVYDPFQIVAETNGRVYGDGQWLKQMDQKWITQYDAIMRDTKDGPAREDRLLSLLKESGVEKEYHGSQY